MQVGSTDEGEPEGDIVDESSTEESESESVDKSINKINKYAKNEAGHEEPLVTDSPVTNEPIYFNLFKFGKISGTGLTPPVNNLAWQPQEIDTILKCIRL